MKLMKKVVDNITTSLNRHFNSTITQRCLDYSVKIMQKPQNPTGRLKNNSTRKFEDFQCRSVNDLFGY